MAILRRTVELQRQKHLVLILAREFASNLSTPTVLTDADGNLVFYNEAAEGVLGRRFSEVEETALDDWLAGFEARTLDSQPVPPEPAPRSESRSISGALRTFATSRRASTASSARSR